MSYGLWERDNQANGKWRVNEWKSLNICQKLQLLLQTVAQQSNVPSTTVFNFVFSIFPHIKTHWKFNSIVRRQAHKFCSLLHPQYEMFTYCKWVVRWCSGARWLNGWLAICLGCNFNEPTKICVLLVSILLGACLSRHWTLIFICQFLKHYIIIGARIFILFMSTGTCSCSLISQISAMQFLRDSSASWHLEGLSLSRS